MDPRTDLQKELDKSELIKMLVNNLNKVKETMRVDAFNHFIDPKDTSHVTGRIFYNVDIAGSNPNFRKVDSTVSLKNADFPLSDALAKHIYGRFEMCGKDAVGLANVIGEIAESLNKDELFNNLMSEFDGKFPGKIEQLRNFIVGQGAFRLSEACVQRTQMLATREIESLESQVNQIKAMHTDRIPKDVQKTIDGLDEQIKDCKHNLARLQKEGNTLLLNLRAGIVKDYVHRFDPDACNSQERLYKEKVQNELKERIVKDSNRSIWDNAPKVGKPAQARSDPTPKGSEKHQSATRKHSAGSVLAITRSMSPGASSPSLIERVKGLVTSRKKPSEQIHHNPYASENESSEESAQAFPGVRQFTDVDKPAELGGDDKKQESGHRSPGMGRGSGDGEK